MKRIIVTFQNCKDLKTDLCTILKQNNIRTYCFTRVFFNCLVLTAILNECNPANIDCILARFSGFTRDKPMSILILN